MAMDNSRRRFLGLAADFKRANARRSTGPGLHSSRRTSAHSARSCLRHLLAATAELALFALQQSLTRGVNEIRVWRNKPSGAHIGGDLATVIRRVHDYVHQDVLLRTAEVLAFCVLVTERAGQTIVLQ